MITTGVRSQFSLIYPDHNNEDGKKVTDLFSAK